MSIPDEVEENDSGKEFFAVERAYRIWVLLFGVLALSLWAQWLGFGAFTEIESEDGSPAILALHLLPLGIAALAMGWRHPAGRLFLFPISFVPGFLLLTEVEKEAFLAPFSLTMAILTLGLYFVVAASRPEALNLLATGLRELRREIEDPHARQFQRTLLGRLGALLFIGVVITYGLFFDPHVAEELRLIGAPADGNQHVFMVVLVYFAWMIVVYMAGILPLLNWEYERRTSPLSQGQKRLLSSPRKLRRRVFLWLGLLLVSLALTLSLLTF